MSAYDSRTVPIVYKEWNNDVKTQSQWKMSWYYNSVRLFVVAAEVSHLGKSFHIVADDLRIRTLKFANYFKALIELGEHVHHRAGEQSVLWRDLELESEKREPVDEELETFLCSFQCWNTLMQNGGVYLYREHTHRSAQLILLQQPVSGVKRLVKTYKRTRATEVIRELWRRAMPTVPAGHDWTEPWTVTRRRELFCWQEEAKFAPGDANWTHGTSDIWAGRIFHCRLSTLLLRRCLGMSESVTCVHSAFSIEPLLITLKPLTWPSQLGNAESAEVLWTSWDLQFGMLSQQILILTSSLHILFQKAGVGCSMFSEW